MVQRNATRINEGCSGFTNLGCGTIQKTLQKDFNTEYNICGESVSNLTNTRPEFSPDFGTESGSEKRPRLQSKVVVSS